MVEHQRLYDRCIPVGEVAEGSEAAKAGFRAHEDFLLGTEQVGFTTLHDVVVHLWERSGQDVMVEVYNKPTDTVRPVVLRVDEGELVPPVTVRGSVDGTVITVWQFGMQLFSSHRGSSPAGLPEGMRCEFPEDCRGTIGLPIEQADPDAVTSLATSEWRLRIEEAGSMLSRTHLGTADKKPAEDK
jgi:hypothetical protein